MNETNAKIIVASDGEQVLFYAAGEFFVCIRITPSTKQEAD